MAKLEYNEALVDESLSLLKKAETEIANTGTNVVSALKTIAGARGANYLDINSMLGAGGLNESCIQLIEQTVTGINERVEMVKEYNEDYENAGLFEKLFSSVGLIGVKFVEGIFGAGEQIIDGFASATAAVLGLVGADGAKESIGEFVKKDHVGDYFQNKYDNEWSDMVKYSAFKEDGLVATAAKIFGTSAGYTGALFLGGGIYGAATHVATAGAGAVTSASILNATATGAKVLMGSVKAAATIAGIGGLGSGTQAAMLSGKTFDEAIWTGVKTGIIQAGTVLVVDWGIKKISKAWAQFKAGNVADDAANAADDVVNAGKNNPNGQNGANTNPNGPNGPNGPKNNPGGQNGANTNPNGPNTNGGPNSGNPQGQPKGPAANTGAASKATQSADDILHAAGKSDQDMLDDLYNAVKKGDISPEAAKQAIETKFKEGFKTAADRKAFGKMWHPDKHSAALDDLANMANNPNAAAQKILDQATEQARVQARNIINKGGSVDEALDAARQAAINAGGSADDVAAAVNNAAKVIKATPADMARYNAKFNPTPSGPAPGSGTPPKAAATPNVQNQAGGKVDDVIEAAAQKAQAAKPGEVIQLGGGDKVDDVIEAAAQQAPVAKPGEVIQLGGGDKVDDVIEAAAQQASVAKPGEVIQLGGQVDDTFNAATDLVQGTPQAQLPQPAEVLKLPAGSQVDEVIDVAEDLGQAAIQQAPATNVAQVSDDMAAALKDYDDLLLRRDQLYNNLTDLGEQVGNAPTSEFLAIRGQIDEVDDLIAQAGQRIADLSTPTGTNLPAVQQPSSTALAVIDDAKLPVVQQPNTTALAVIDDAKLPVVQQPNSTALAVIDDAKPPVVQQPNSTALAVIDDTKLPANVTDPTDLVVYNPDPTDLVPYNPGPTDLVPYNPGPTDIVPYNPGPTDIVPYTPTPPPVVPTPTPTPVVPTPVPPPVPVVPTPVPITPVPVTPVPIIPTPVPIEPTPTPVPIDPAPVPIVPTDPVVTPDPPVITPDPTPVTPDPTPVVPEDPVPTPPEEYAPIPNTGIGGSGKTILDYLAPGAVGAAIGLTGILGAKALKDKKEDEEEEEF